MSLHAVEANVRNRLGLDPNSLGPSALTQAVELRMKARGLQNQEEYARLLVRDTSESDSLAAELVVPESWFFRGSRALFNRMAEFLAGRVANQAAGKRVRVLSIPCSTGEEPYSLAIACHEHFIPPDSYLIDAVDVSVRHLERAEAARFSAFSFREAGPDIRPPYFRQLGERWELLPHLRQLVHFRIANLTDPAFLIGEQPYDLIVCRNLFIYLTLEGKRRAMSSLDRLLALDGMMCLTPGEADRLPPGQFALASSGEAGLYRRVGAENLDVATVVPRSDPKPTPHVWKVDPPPAPPIIPMPHDPVPVCEPPQGVTLAATQELANSGLLVQARESCEKLIRQSPASAEVYSLLGTILLALGQREEATEAFRRALYLNPEHQEAISHMIVINDRKGNKSQSDAFRRRLSRLTQEEAK